MFYATHSHKHPTSLPETERKPRRTCRNGIITRNAVICYAHTHTAHIHTPSHPPTLYARAHARANVAVVDATGRAHHDKSRRTTAHACSCFRPVHLWREIRCSAPAPRQFMRHHIHSLRPPTARARAQIRGIRSFPPPLTPPEPGGYPQPPFLLAAKRKDLSPRGGGQDRLQKCQKYDFCHFCRKRARAGWHGSFPDHHPYHAAFAAYAATRRKWTLQRHIIAPAVQGYGQP